MNLHSFGAQTESKDGKTSWIQHLRKMSTRAKIASAACAVLVLAAAGTGVFLLTGHSQKSAPVSAVSVVSSKPVVTALSLSQTSVTLETGKTTQIAATLKPAGTGKKAVWKSSDKKIATVSSSGLITAVAKGTCTVMASVGTTVSASVKITVKDPGDEEIALLKAYLKNGIKKPAPFTETLANTTASLKALDDAAIVDLNGNHHYELIVEHLFKYIDDISPQTTQCLPFFEVYYVKDGKVVKSPEDFGRENWEDAMSAGFGTSTEYVDYYLAQDPETKTYYFVKFTCDSAEAANGITGPWCYTANVLDGARVTPIMKLYAGLGQYSGLNDKQNDDSFIFALNKNQVNESSLQEAEKRLKAVCFDISYHNRNDKADDVISENTSFKADQVKVYKNSIYPKSFLSDIVKKDKKKFISNPSILIGMDLSQIQKTYGDTLKSGFQPSESTFDEVDDMEEYPYTLGVGDAGSNDNAVRGIIVRRHNANIYKDAKIGMTYAQIKKIFGDHMSDLEKNDSEADGTGTSTAYINNFRYCFDFDSAKPNSTCTYVSIIKE